MTTQNIKDEINSFARLPNNWDGYGGIPVFDEIYISTNDLIDCLDAKYIEKISDVFPNSNGTITIEFYNNPGGFASLEIGLDNYSCFIKFNDKEPKFINGGKVTGSLQAIKSDLAALF